MRFFQIAVALAVVPFTIATGQSRSAAWPLDSGSRVRIQAPIFSGKELQGTVVATQGDTLRFRPLYASADHAVALNDITRLDVHQGTHGRKLKGALLGFVIGAGLAAGITAATWKKPAPNDGFGFDFGQGGDAAFAGAFGGIAGGIVGLVIGAFQTDTWTPVKLPK
ncbi:MAG: hypothetical protein QOD47_1498 [Gemmatimonadaceae bacterium]|jgi:hypothetical protein|nr:hypothetical protein [Gemmatimonadaceae bacterium]